MKKITLLIFTVIALSCNSDDSPPDPILGKWMVFKAVYENAVYEYEINGQCGQELLEILDYYNDVAQTYYSNDDCSGYSTTRPWYWTNEGNNRYTFRSVGQIPPERTVVLNGNEIQVTESEDITVTKYYRRIE